MISVDEAVARITRGFAALPSEAVPVAEAAGRVLAQDAVAKLDQPPAPMSQWTANAVRCADASPGAELALIGDAPAGRPFGGTVRAGQAVRIFTGGVVPEGADAVVIQEDTELKGKLVVIKEAHGRRKMCASAPWIFAPAKSCFAAGTVFRRAMSPCSRRRICRRFR